MRECTAKAKKAKEKLKWRHLRHLDRAAAGMGALQLQWHSHRAGSSNVDALKESILIKSWNKSSDFTSASTLSPSLTLQVLMRTNGFRSAKDRGCLLLGQIVFGWQGMTLELFLIGKGGALGSPSCPKCC